MNKKIWETIFGIMKPIDDNVLVVTVLFTIFFAMLITVLLRKRKNLIPICGCFYMLSLTHLIENLPFIHNRINTALSLTSNIILQSSTYLSDFLSATGLESADRLKIINVLYYMEYKNALLKAEPMDLYYHFYSAMDKAKGSWFGYIDKPIMTLNAKGVLLIALILLISFKVFLSSKGTFIVLFDIALVSISLFINVGAFINMIIFCLISGFYIYLFNINQNRKIIKVKNTYYK